MFYTSQFHTSANSPASPIGRSPVRWVAGVVLAIVVIGALTVAWVFMRQSRTITMTENGTFRFKNYTIMLDAIARNLCPVDAAPNCEENKKEPTVQVRIRRDGDTTISYQYLAPTIHPQIYSQGLEIELLSLDMTRKSVELKLTKK